MQIQLLRLIIAVTWDLPWLQYAANKCRPTPNQLPLLQRQRRYSSPLFQPGDGTDLMDALLERGVIRVGIRVWPEANVLSACLSVDFLTQPSVVRSMDTR
jgi:hypothetical protein